MKNTISTNGTPVGYRVLVLVMLSLLLAVVAACDSAGGDSGGTPTPEPYALAHEGHPTGSTQKIPDPKEAVETRPIGQLPDFVSKMTDGPAKDKTAALYMASLEHYDEFSHIPCYCGCAVYETHHHSLAECFLKSPPTGSEATFTDHSVTCDICQQVAQMTIDGVAQGTPLKDIRSQVFDKFKYTGIWTDTPPVP